MPRGQCTKLEINKPEDFWNYVNVGHEDSCWEWQAGRHTQGYGGLHPNGKHVYAHRYAYMITTGTILTPRQKVLHSCDNPPCCNPKHLFLGTQLDNMRDKIAKGRARSLKGSECTNAKLNEFQVSAIRRMYAAGGHTQMELAARFGVSFTTVNSIIRRRAWKHVA